MSNLPRTAHDSDPFTGQTAHALTATAKFAAPGGLATWTVSTLAAAALTATVLTSGLAFQVHDSPVAWLAIALIFAAFGQFVARGVAMRTELDTLI